jgi:endo-1,4-beta-xylanase
MNRRHFLEASGRLGALGLPWLAGLSACGPAKGCEGDWVEAASDQPIKVQAEQHGLLFGTAAHRAVLTENPRYAAMVIAECSMITPEDSMKWERIRPEPDGFDFENADWLVNFADQNGLLVHGHTLAWHLQMPPWFDEVANRRNAEKLLTGHIETLVGRYAGGVRSWDVVNEAIAPEDDRGDGLANTPWVRFLGPGYIDLAFRTAAAADPDAILVLNDYGVEYPDDYSELRRSHLLDLLTGLVASGTPVHALGVQSHLFADRAPDFERFERFLADVAALGLDIMITELDARDHGLPADETARDCLVAETYRAFLDVVMATPSLRSLAVWGLSDRYSWLNYMESRDDGESMRPLPLDSNLQRKPAWNAISRAIADR